MIKVLAVLGFCLVQAVFVGAVEGAGKGWGTYASTITDEDFKAYFSPMARSSVESVVVFDPRPNEDSLIAALSGLNIGFGNTDSAFDMLFWADMGALSKSLGGAPASWCIWIIKISRNLSIKGNGVYETTPASSRRRPRILPSDRKGVCGGLIDIPNRSPFSLCGNNDISPQLSLGTILGDSVGPEGDGNRQGRNKDSYDKGYDLAHRGDVLLSHPFDSLVSRISHATLFAQISFIAALWAIAIGAIYASGGYLGYYGWRNARGRWGFLFLFCGGWGLFALNVALIGALP